MNLKMNRISRATVVHMAYFILTAIFGMSSSLTDTRISIANAKSHFGHIFRVCPTEKDPELGSCWAPYRNPSCSPLNTKERRLFFNYHMTHHAGTSLAYMADRAELPWDGMLGNYLPREGIHKPSANASAAEIQSLKNALLNKWLGSIDYIKKSDKSIMPVDMLSFSDRAPTGNKTVEFSLPRRYVAIENTLDEIWSILPLDDNRVNSMIVMRNPISRLLKMLDHIMLGSNQANLLPGYLSKIDPRNITDRTIENAINRFNSYSLKHMIGAHHTEFAGFRRFEGTKEKYEKAAARLERFDHVLILEAFSETSQFLCCEWKWKYCDSLLTSSKSGKGKHSSEIHKMFNNSALYRYILDENTWELKLYDKAKELAKMQMRKLGLPSPVLDRLPIDTKQWMLDELSK